MHEYLLNDLISSASRQRLREAEQHELGRVARRAGAAGTSGPGAWLRGRLRFGRIVEPVRVARQSLVPRSSEPSRLP